MRDIVLTAVIAVFLLMVFKHPHYGIYLWSWLAYMNPHKQAWGFAYNMPFALLAAVVTIVAYFLSKEPKRFIWSPEIVVLLIFIGWMLFTTFFAFYPNNAWAQWDKVWKIQLMTFLTLMMITNRQRLNGLIWVIVLSLGYYGVKGGIFTIMTGGAFIVWGPSGTFIEGNNELALALIMMIPLIRYLHLQETRPWIRRGLAAAMLLCAVAAIGSQSRGAFLAIMSMGLFLWLKSRQKVVTGFFAIVIIAFVALFMPAEWYERMGTIQNYEEDGSAMGRINAWHTAFNLAMSRITGGGFETFEPAIFSQYAPNPLQVHDVHSVYFEVMGEHGFIGLGLWLLLGALTWIKAGKVIRACKNNPSQKWAADLSSMIQVSMVGYATGGAFLGLAYFDLYYHIIVMAVLAYDFAVKGTDSSPVAAASVPNAPEQLPHPSSRWDG